MEKYKMEQLRILKYIFKYNITTVNNISNNVNLSDKTTRKYLDLLNDYLIDNSIGYIDRTPGVGVSLNYNKDKEWELEKLINSKEISNDSLKVQIIDNLLLNTENYITQTELSEKVFVSVPTLRKHLKVVADWFARYSLSLESIPNKGMCLEGEETDFRRAIKNYILMKNKEDVGDILESFSPTIDIHEIKDLIQQVENKWKLQFSNESFNKIWILVCLSLNRNDIVNYNFEEHIQEYSEYEFSKSIYSLLEDHGYTSYTENDIRYLALEILGSNILEVNNNDIENGNQNVIGLDSFVKEVILSISDILSEDLTDDIILFRDLKNHLKSAIFRMKHGKEISNETSQQIKENYNRTYLSTWSTSQLFEKYYNVQVTEAELSYITLYIESALMRKKDKADVVFVTNQSNSQVKFITDLIKRNVNQIENIEIKREVDIRKIEDSNKLIIADYQMSSKEIDNVLYISPLPKGSDFRNIQNKLQEIKKVDVNNTYFSQEIAPLFNPNVFFMDASDYDKESLLATMVNKLEDMGYVSTNYLDSILKRESKTSTCIGNNTAIPHGEMKEVNSSTIAVATIPNGIQWFDDEVVNIVFLLAVKNTTEVNIERTKQFYSNLITFTENKEAVGNFIDITDNIEGYNYLFSY